MEISEARQHDQTDQLVMPEGPAQSQCAPLLACKQAWQSGSQPVLATNLSTETCPS